MNVPAGSLSPYRLDDRYTLTEGRIFLTGTQALVRIMLDQARRDREAGWNTGGFVSGYRGSPLGALDGELWRMNKRLAEDRIKFLPAINEDLGATAVLGAQQATLDPDCEVEGVFSMWYGKGPGVDRSGDALKHGNAYGSSARGGVLVVAGDDHGCVSSSMPHQSDVAFMAWFMPTLNPASVSEYLEYGEYGFALSRFTGTWVGFKAISETVESGQSVPLRADRQFVHPEFTAPPGGLHIRSTDLPSAEIETRMAAKLEAVEAFVEANPLDRAIYGVKDARFGFVTTGKGHLDLMEALRLLGVDKATCNRLGIDIYKVGMVWPLARRAALEFVRGKREILVIEEKRGIIESQLKEHFYDWPGSKPERMVGKHDENLDPLVPFTGELSPRKLVPIIAARLDGVFPELDLAARADEILRTEAVPLMVPGATRTPYFCSGCPHNTSTKLPDGSKAASGIGCHVMASWMGRNTVGFAQMGGEGVPWAAASMWNGHKHQFQNIGEGTWYHSGSLAVRQAVAAGANITFKVLYNDAVAMTGGQPVDGPISVTAIAQASRAEGIERIAIVSDDIGKFNRSDFPSGTSFHDRADLDPLQRALRDVPGVSVMIYEQTCATEKRRRRKRGTLEDPKRFAVINPAVCEGCGDCSVESNCLSVEPVETEFGTKRKINQSSCKKDFSCLNGFCPSFVTVEGAERRKKTALDVDWSARAAALPRPQLADLGEPHDLLVGGVGGTGVVTVGAIISMAAHLDGRGASVLDFTGFAQKFGTVLGYVRIAATPDSLNQVRIDDASADAVIGCDAVVCSSPKASVHFRPGTRVVLNEAEMPTGDLVLNRDARLRIPERVQTVSQAVGAENVAAFDSNRLAEDLLGDPVFGNMILLGYAWQAGFVPVTLEAMAEAIRLNGVALDLNRAAFDIGRLKCGDAHAIEDMLAPPAATLPQTAAQLIDHRAACLTDYQDAAYAASFRETLDGFAKALPADNREAWLTLAARSLFKLMAYKDEYEVARLHCDPSFAEKLRAEFGEGARVNYHLAPPILSRGADARGRPRKRSFGPWMRPVFSVLARARHLRGGPLDPFRWQADRKLERSLIDWYRSLLATVAQRSDTLPASDVETLLRAPMDIRGFGPVKEKAVAEVKERVARVLAGEAPQA
ncbi:indolepyruvate ferredoxin oxidoreductase family protein [Sulfitobacter sp. HNIBRBA3233]|uniref:indolepyruvate ferredoxin oxidoreductase family protein n=1 Tax=Sulfitobacter marinivivus TaxID=3158558 RepID=UPI0032DFC739